MAALGVLVVGCRNPSSKEHPSVQATATPPVPPAPTSTTEVTSAHAARSYGRFHESEPQVRDGSVACSVTIERSAVAGPDYILQNTGNLDLRSCTVVFYAYDANGKQLARMEADPFVNRKGPALKPAETIRAFLDGDEAKKLEQTPGVTWEAVVTNVVFGDGTTWSDPARAPAQRKSQAIPK